MAGWEMEVPGFEICDNNDEIKDIIYRELGKLEKGTQNTLEIPARYAVMLCRDLLWNPHPFHTTGEGYYHPWKVVTVKVRVFIDPQDNLVITILPRTNTPRDMSDECCPRKVHIVHGSRCGMTTVNFKVYTQRTVVGCRTQTCHLIDRMVKPVIQFTYRKLDQLLCTEEEEEEKEVIIIPE